MKRFVFLAATLVLCLGTLHAAVWNYPQDGSTVGNPTLFDCTAPVTPNYIKLWIAGNSIWTVHGTNRLAFAYYLPNGVYTANCQYDDGTVHNNTITITVTDNLYDAVNVDDEPWSKNNPSQPYWEWSSGGTSTLPQFDSSLDPTKSTDGQSRKFFASLTSGGGSFQDIYFYEKRCNVPIGRRAGHFMVNFNAEAGSQPRAYEFGFTQWYGGRNYRMAFQANYAGGTWRVYDPTGSGWHETNVTISQAPIPSTEFKRVYLVGHPFTDSSGNERTAFDLIQIGECTTAPCSDRDADPIHAVPITSVVNEPSNSVGTLAESCAGGEGNSQSVQLDLDTTNGSSQIWTDKYLVHLLP